MLSVLDFSSIKVGVMSEDLCQMITVVDRDEVIQVLGQFCKRFTLLYTSQCEELSLIRHLALALKALGSKHSQPGIFQKLSLFTHASTNGYGILSRAEEVRKSSGAPFKLHVAGTSWISSGHFPAL